MPTRGFFAASCSCPLRRAEQHPKPRPPRESTLSKLIPGLAISPLHNPSRKLSLISEGHQSQWGHGRHLEEYLIRTLDSTLSEMCETEILGTISTLLSYSLVRKIQERSYLRLTCETDCFKEAKPLLPLGQGVTC